MNLVVAYVKPASASDQSNAKAKWTNGIMLLNRRMVHMVNGKVVKRMFTIEKVNGKAELTWRKVRHVSRTMVLVTVAMLNESRTMELVGRTMVKLLFSGLLVRLDGDGSCLMR